MAQLQYHLAEAPALLRIASVADGQRPRHVLDSPTETSTRAAHTNAYLATNSTALQICVATIQRIRIAYAVHRASWQVLLVFVLLMSISMDLTELLSRKSRSEEVRCSLTKRVAFPRHNRVG